jgi:hypothetical protein
LAGLCVLGAILTGCEECHTGCRYTKLNAEFVGRPGIEYAPIEQVTWTISLDGCDYKVEPLVGTPSFEIRGCADQDAHC